MVLYNAKIFQHISAQFSLRKPFFSQQTDTAAAYHYSTVRWWCRRQNAVEWTPGHTDDWTVTRRRQYLSTAGRRPCCQRRRLNRPDKNTTLTGYCKHRSRRRPNNNTRNLREYEHWKTTFDNSLHDYRSIYNNLLVRSNYWMPWVHWNTLDQLECHEGHPACKNLWGATG